MYLPAHFEEPSPEALHALMRSRPLATLLTMGGSSIAANHIPVETLSEPAPWGTIRGHIAKANPLWKEYREGSEALLIFQGAQAYISPSFYPSKKVTGEVVPTWDYAVVHARGSLQFIHDAAWLRALVSRLTQGHEESRPQPWSIEDAPTPYLEKMLSMIVGFELCVTKLTGKFKLSQNHTRANRGGVVHGLQAGSSDAQEIAQMLAAFNDGHPD